MALNVGSRLGHYDVTALIAEGGMGQVYQATDTKLNREVALKILPEAFAGDPDRLARFQREAQVLASLNHPNIAQIHGLEESDGTRALVLELVEGPTLADRIAQGPIPVDEALPIAKQIAEALEAAHEAGVIHRDLKPANIKVKDDGTVKVLDFGLAKALDTAPVGDPSLSPTLTAAATQMGVIMGTAAYMSPEQARGRAVDSRADIWGFGVVLYEMLTGKRAFEGEDVSLTLSTVLQREPDWSLLPVDVPVGVLTCLRRCLEKDSRQRIQAAGDVRLVIGGAFDIPGNAAGDLSSDRPQSSSRWRLGLVAVPVALLAAVTGFLVGGGTDENALPVMRTSISLPHPDGLFDIRGALAVAPDGRVVVYVTNDARLYQRPLDQQEPVEIATDGPASTPFFSPDGEWLGYYAEDTAEFRKVSLRQGTATVIVGSARIPAGVSWSADNRILFGQGADGIGQVSADGGTTEVLVAVEDGEQASQPSLLPDGETLLFTLAGSAAAAGAETLVVAQSLSTGERRVLIEDGANARYVSTGHLVYMRDGELHGATFDVDRLVVTGPPVPLGEQVAVGSAVSTAQFGLSTNGLLVYAGRDAFRTDRRFVWADRSGQESEIDVPSGDYRFPALSPDNTLVAARVNEPATGNADIYVFDLERGTQTRLTSSFATDAFPLWTRDGQAIVFWSTRAGSDLYRTRADGSDDPELLTTPGSLTGLLRGIGWSGDGETVVFRGGSGEVLSVGPEGQTPEPILREPIAGFPSSLTADGRWLAYVSSQSGRPEVYVRPFPEVSENRWQISTDEGVRPLWRPDGAELFYRNATGTLMSVPVSVGTTFAFGTPEPLFDLRSFSTFDVDVTSDGQRFLLTRDDLEASPSTTELTIIQDWHQELLEHVPVN